MWRVVSQPLMPTSSAPAAGYAHYGDAHSTPQMRAIRGEQS
jgi:hypothetical protein